MPAGHRGDFPALRDSVLADGPARGDGVQGKACFADRRDVALHGEIARRARTGEDQRHVALLESLPGEDDPAERTAAGHRIANLLVRGAHDPADQDLVDRVLHLADSEGLGTIAELKRAGVDI